MHVGPGFPHPQWILLRFEGPGVGRPFDMTTHSFVVGRKVVASVFDEAAQGMLNVEAKPFVPR